MRFLALIATHARAGGYQGNEISFVPEIAAREGDACKACFPLCPTSYLQAAYVLTGSPVFPGVGGGRSGR